MKQKEFEKELPSGYQQVFYLNAKSVKVGVIMNLIALVILALVMVVAIILMILTGNSDRGGYYVDDGRFIIAMMVFIVAMLAYIVLHELVHGIAYKWLTGEKLTFGISWSCAFCGVPNIYVKRRVALISCAAPLVVFSIFFLALAGWYLFVNSWYYLLTAVLFGLHLGGCSGDIYIILLMLFRYRNPETLIRDTGPEQTVYVPISDCERKGE